MWAWSGALTPTSVEVRVRATPGDMVYLQVTPATANAIPLTPVVADRFGIARFGVTGLMPGTPYRYDAMTERTAITGGFRTPASGPSSFRVAFASCARTGSNAPVFERIRQLDPLFFVHMGDLHYEDIASNRVDRFAQAFDDVFASPHQSAFFRQIPVVYMWDDHDYGPNDSNRSSPSRTAALAAYRAFVPHYPLTTPDGSIQQAFTIGRVRFIITDARSARSSRRVPEADRTMLGAEQTVWLERELAAVSTFPVVVWVNTVPWITKGDEGSQEGWAPYARERARIANAIETAGLTKKLVMLSGDMHALALDDGTHSQYATTPGASATGFVVAHAAPLDQASSKKGGPYTVGPLTTSGQFGTLDIVDAGGDIGVVIQGQRASGAVAAMRLALRCGPAGCRPVG
jgi:phosphodiesterase/alkaline phosphatase D-like protein